MHRTHHLTLAVVACHHFQCLHDNESSYHSIGGGNGRDDAASHGYGVGWGGVGGEGGRGKRWRGRGEGGGRWRVERVERGRRGWWSRERVERGRRGRWRLEAKTQQPLIFLTLDIKSTLYWDVVVEGSQIRSCYHEIQRDLVILAKR